MTEETRHDRYHRILQHGVNGKEDHEDARYLIDKGYLDGKYQLSYMRDSYGKVHALVSRGPTADGFDYIDELKNKINSSMSEVKVNAVHDSAGYPASNESHEPAESKISLYKIVEGVIVGVLVLIVGWSAAYYLGIQL